MRYLWFALMFVLACAYETYVTIAIATQPLAWTIITSAASLVFACMVGLELACWWKQR